MVENLNLLLVGDYHFNDINGTLKFERSPY